jgi:hypothetical protein
VRPPARGGPAIDRRAAGGGPSASASPTGLVARSVVRRAPRAAVIDVILPAFAEKVLAAAVAGVSLSRDLAAGRASTCRPALTTSLLALLALLASLAPLRDAGWRRSANAISRRLTTYTPKVIWIPRRRARQTGRGGPRVPADRRSARPATDRGRARRIR